MYYIGKYSGQSLLQLSKPEASCSNVAQRLRTLGTRVRGYLLLQAQNLAAGVTAPKLQLSRPLALNACQLSGSLPWIRARSLLTQLFTDSYRQALLAKVSFSGALQLVSHFCCCDHHFNQCRCCGLSTLLLRLLSMRQVQPTVKTIHGQVIGHSREPIMGPTTMYRDDT